MKKKLEAELISIAHRVLKLKNREETKQLQEEAKKLYEQLTILRFYEEHFEVLKADISVEALEAKLEKHVVTLEEEPKETLHEIVEEPVFDEPILSEEITKEEEIIAEVVQPALFDTIDVENYKEVDFVKVEEVPIEVEKAASLSFERAFEPKEEVIHAESARADVFEKIEAKEIEPAVIFETKKDVGEEEPRTMSLNDRLTKGIAFGLNDRIAFEKRLFGGNPDDFNRVVSQLNTFDSFEEAKGFINDFVKPDYNNWDGKEEFETRFLEIIERKFS